MSQTALVKNAAITVSIVFFLFLFLITLANASWFDESLDPEVTKLMKPATMPKDQENAYFAIWGLEASSDKDPIAVGLALISKYRSNRDERGLDEITSQDYQTIRGGSNLDEDWQAQLPKCRFRTETGCHKKLVTQLEHISLENPRLNLMLDRYKQVTQLRQFKSIADKTFKTPLPAYSIVMDLKKLNLAIAQQSGVPQNFIDHLSQDMMFWRMLLEKGDTVLDKMIAIASIWSDLQAASDFLTANTDLTETQLIQLGQILTPLTPREIDISEAFAFEEIAFYRTLIQSDSKALKNAFGLESEPLSWLLQPNATINAYHQYFTKEIESLNQLSTEAFSKKIIQKSQSPTSCCFTELRSIASFSPTTLYNLGGKLLLSVTVYNAENYLARVHDLNGMLTLVNIKLSAVQQGESKVADLKTSPIIAGHKITYDEATESLKFKCLELGSLCQIQLK